MQLVLGDPPTGLRRPVLLAGFGGWGDAGSAASIALRHLLGDVAPPPKVAFYPLALPGAERDLLILLGPEPHFRWPELAPAIIAYARAAGVQSMLTLGAYVGPVTHKSAPVVRRTLDESLGSRLEALSLQDTDYEGPTAFVTALLHAAAAGGLSAASLWVATPPYLQAGNPVAALALLETTSLVTQLPLEMERLREVANSFLHDVEAALEEHPELAEQLKEMLEAEEEDEEDDVFDQQAHARWPKAPDPDRPPPDAPPGLPSGKSLVEAVEKYLKQARGEDGPSPRGPAV
jgi:proteasome assembly chaperone (PAC2) family protein